MLATKYRPFSTLEVVGNETTKKDLENRAKSQSYPEVMLFSGESGTGKSTLASIVAATLNCHNPATVNGTVQPCGECAACRDIRSESYSRDVTFFDGSQLGKDGIEQIKGQVAYAPMYDANRVVIIDEAQNITKSGLEATLKLLESTRTNTYFILCTMNEKAIHKAIKSRAQLYRFKPVEPETIGEYLFSIIEAEDPNEELPETLISEGIMAIAENSGGSVRQAVANLERALMSELYTADAIEAEMGLVSEQKSYQIMNELLTLNPAFFEHVKNIGVTDFYRYALKVLKNVSVSAVYESPDEPDWRAAANRKMFESDLFWPLLDLFLQIESISGTFLNEDTVMAYIARFFYSRSRESATRTRMAESTPIRRTTRRTVTP